MPSPPRPTARPGRNPNAVRHLELSTSQFDISLDATLPRSAQGHPVIFQAGDSPTGRDFAAAQCRCHLLAPRHALRRRARVRQRHPRAAGRRGQARGRHQDPAGDPDRAGGARVGGGGEATLGARRSVHRADCVVPGGPGMGARSLRPRPRRSTPGRRSGACTDLGDPRRGQGRQGSDRHRQGVARARGSQEPVAARGRHRDVSAFGLRRARRARSPTSSPAGYAQARPTASTSRRTSCPADSTRSSTGWCPNSRNAAYTGLSTRRRRCAVTSDFVNR